MRVRLAIIAAIAVLLSSLSLSAVIGNAGWIATGTGAIAVVLVAGC